MNKQNILLTGAGVLVVILVITIGIFWSKYIQATKELSNQQSVIRELQQEIQRLEQVAGGRLPEAGPEEETLNTSTWQTYRNEELGISLKYPAKWELEKCMEFIKGGGFGASAQHVPECSVWIDFVDEHFFYKLTLGTPLEGYFSKGPPIFYFYQDSGFIDYSKIKISTRQEGVILDGYMCYHEPCPSEGPCGDVPPLAYCAYQKILVVYLHSEDYPVFVAGKKWGRECIDEEIVKGLYFSQGLEGLHPYIEQEYKSCQEERKAELQIFDQFVNEIQIW